MNREVCFTVSKEFKIFASFAPDPLCKADPYWKIPKCCLNDKTILYKKKRNSLRKKSRERGTEKKKEGRKERTEGEKEEGRRKTNDKYLHCFSIIGRGRDSIYLRGFSQF